MPYRPAHKARNFLSTVVLGAISFVVLESLAMAGDGQLAQWGTARSVASQPAATASPKIDQHLRRALQARREFGPTSGSTRFGGPARQVRFDADGFVQVYLHWREATLAPDRLSRRFGARIELTNERLRITQAWVPEAALERLAAEAEIGRISAPSYARQRAGSVKTEGDAILKANLLRGYGITGKGARVGVLSDGANTIAAGQASGDLPADLARYGTCQPSGFDGANCDFGSTCNEGTAIAEIIHDMAPDAKIAVAAVGTDLEFIARLDDLKNDFGATVIIDDLGFFGEPYFEDGAVAAAVQAIADDVVYVSAAGNSALGHYEQLSLSTPASGGVFHDFGFRAGRGTSDISMNIRVPPGEFLVAILQWNDPFGGSTNDLDMGLLDSTLANALCPSCISAGLQNGTQDPLEAVCCYNSTGATVTAYMLVERFSGTDRYLELVLFGGDNPEYNDPSGSVVGHPTMANVLAVGAIDAADPGHDTIEPYSSRGPAIIRLPGFESRAKPDLVAIDGVSVTGAGGRASFLSACRAS